jgi:hypothetical protein
MSYNEFYQSMINSSIVEGDLIVDGLAVIRGDLDVKGNIIGEIVGAAGDLETTGADVNISASAPPTTGQVLKATSATTATWQDPSASTPTTTRGDIIKRGTTVDERLAIGTVNQVLTSNGTEPVWQDPSGGETKIVNTDALVRVTDDGVTVNARGNEAVDLQFNHSSNNLAIAGGLQSVIIGGEGNVIAPLSSRGVICGGYINELSDLGGTAPSNHSFIGSGQSNFLEGSNFAVICGGDSNSIYPSGAVNYDFTCILGGQFNIINDGAYSSVLGGANNEVSSVNSTVCGSNCNTNSQDNVFMFNSKGTTYSATAPDTAYFNVDKLQVDGDIRTNKLIVNTQTGIQIDGTILSSANVAGGFGDITTAFASTYVGSQAGLSNSGSKNTYIGYDTGGSSGSQNTFVGSSAGDNVTGSSNVCIGLNAGNSIAGSANCVMLGMDADGIAGGNYQIALGSNVECDSSSQCMIGNTNVFQIVNEGDGICDLGSTTHRFKNLYLTGDITTTNYDSIPVITQQFANGSITTPTAASAGDVLGELSASGHDGTSFPATPSAYIEFKATTTHSGTNRETEISFATTASNSTSSTEAIKIDSAGVLFHRSYTFLQLGVVSPSTRFGGVIFVSDAVNGTGTNGSLCYSNGVNWIDMITNTTVTNV